jgi:hypothetical protein
MPDNRTIETRSYTFVDLGDGRGQHVFGLPDGSCLNVVVTILTQAALANVQIAEAVNREVERQVKRGITKLPDISFGS